MKALPVRARPRGATRDGRSGNSRSRHVVRAGARAPADGIAVKSRPRRPRIPARAQRGRRRCVRVGARASGTDRRPCLRELRLPSLCPRPGARRREGPEARVSSRARSQAPDPGVVIGLGLRPGSPGFLRFAVRGPGGTRSTTIGTRCTGASPIRANRRSTRTRCAADSSKPTTVRHNGA
jgi:hypothetical protein